MNNLSSLLLFIGRKLVGLQNQIYPVGSIYICTHTTNPSVLFGGTWRKIEGRFLLASSTGYTLGATGGSANAIIPSHRHYVAQVTGGITGGSHYHSMKDIWSSGSGSHDAYKYDGKRSRQTRYTDYASHSHDMPAHYTDYSGEDTTGKNMPPYLVVNVWERTA